MITAKVFKTGRSQAVRLPKEFRFDSDEVIVARMGKGIVLYPPKHGWDLLVDSLDKFSPDFMAERRQPPWPKKRKLL